MKEDHQKPLKKLTLFFLSKPVPLNGQNYQKLKGTRTSDQLLFRLRNKFRTIPLLLMYYLTKFYDVYVKRFLSYSKNYMCKIMQANSLHHKLFHSHLSFRIWKMWKGRVNITKSWTSWERKELFQWNKKHFFIVFEGLSFDEKIKIW